jgi:predicted methyltransferase
MRTECHGCDGHGYRARRYADLYDGYLSTAITTRPCRQHHDDEGGWLIGFVPPL